MARRRKYPERNADCQACGEFVSGRLWSFSVALSEVRVNEWRVCPDCWWELKRLADGMQDVGQHYTSAARSSYARV